MNEAEKERLIKKDIASIENRVRHAFNQGYEMGLKESRSENPNTCGDAVSRKHLLEEIALLKKSPWFNENTYGSKVIRKEAVEIVEDVCIKREPSVIPQPMPCGDAVSRDAVLNLMRDLTRWCIRSEDGKWKNVGLLYDDVMFGIDRLPSVTPQQRTGRWIQKEEEGDAEPFIIWECSECHCVDEDGKPSYKYCPQCGARMGESEDKE